MDEKKLAKDKDQAAKPEAIKPIKDQRYKVLVSFSDDKDNFSVYIAGRDIYPREGYKPSEKRVEYLLGSENNFKRPVIEPID